MRTTLVLLAWLLATGGCSPSKGGGRCRNIVLVVVDTLRADRLSCYGYPRPTSPHIDALAAAGTRYENCRPQGSVTIASMISMMSGLYVTRAEEVLPAYAPTLAERVAATGRVTAAFVGNKVLTGERGFQRGFDLFEMVGNGRGEEIVKRFSEWLGQERDRVERDGMFVWLHIMDPHTPHNPKPEHRDRFSRFSPGRRALIQGWRQDVQEIADLAGVELDPTEVNRALARMLRANDLYDAEVAGVDDAIGALTTLLEESGLAEETLIIFCADHGEELYELPRYPEELRALAAKGRLESPDQGFTMGHGWSFREAAWRTPLILSGPGIPKGAVVRELTANLDIYPTVLDAAGAEIPRSVVGQSLLDGPPRNRSKVLAFTNEMVAVIDESGEKFVDRRDRLARYDGFWRPEDGEPEELVDVRSSAGDRENLAPAHRDRVEAYRRLIEDWRKAHARETDTTLSAYDIEALRELGYLGDG